MRSEERGTSAGSIHTSVEHMCRFLVPPPAPHSLKKHIISPYIWNSPLPPPPCRHGRRDWAGKVSNRRQGHCGSSLRITCWVLMGGRGEGGGKRDHPTTACHKLCTCWSRAIYGESSMADERSKPPPRNLAPFACRSSGARIRRGDVRRHGTKRSSKERLARANTGQSNPIRNSSRMPAL